MAVNEMTSDLIIAMDKWLKGHKSRTKRSLQVRTKLGYQTITDILQGERNASFETVFAILPTIFGYDEELAFLKKHVPGFEKHFKKLGHHENDTINSYDIQQAFRDEQNFVILTLAAGRGTTTEEIKGLFDEIGLIKLNYLLNSGILRQINGRIKSVKEYFYHIDVETVLTMMKHFTNLFYKEGIGQPGYFCKVRTDNISDGDKNKIHDILRECFERISTIAVNSNGENVFYTGMVMSILSEGGERN